MSDKEIVLGMTLSSLGLPKPTLNLLLQLVEQACRRAGKVLSPEELQSLTVAQLIEAKILLQQLSETMQRNLFESLVAYGLTRFDWEPLPQHSITRQLILERTKDEWLELPAAYLGTVSRSFLEEVAPLGSDLKRFTVRSLIQLVPEEIEVDRIVHSVMSSYRDGYESTKKLLFAIGFSCDDGPFFKIAERYEAIAALATKYGIHYNKAREFLRIARVEGWVT